LAGWQFPYEHSNPGQPEKRIDKNLFCFRDCLKQTDFYFCFVALYDTAYFERIVI